jgi:hypothetical protein
LLDVLYFGIKVTPAASRSYILFSLWLVLR